MTWALVIASLALIAYLGRNQPNDGGSVEQKNGPAR